MLKVSGFVRFVVNLDKMIIFLVMKGPCQKGFL